MSGSYGLDILFYINGNKKNRTQGGECGFFYRVNAFTRGVSTYHKQIRRNLLL